MAHPFTTQSNEAMRAFIDSCRKTPRSNLTVSDVIKKNKQSNHEIWKQCYCGCFNDLRKTDHCEECGAKL